MSNGKPTITPLPNGPYKVEGLTHLATRHGPVDASPTMALCRCGGSANKPFCDGTHAKNGFTSDKSAERVPDKRESHVGREVTVFDNRGLCAHAGYCTDGLPTVFRIRQEPFVDPNGAGRDEVIEAVKKCPSGALSHAVEGVEARDQERDPAVFIAPNGPYVVTGGPKLVGVERGAGASTEHFTLCRCGGSRNKPYCDGSHWSNGFSDDRS